jgi:hypothetical protein
VAVSTDQHSAAHEHHVRSVWEHVVRRESIAPLSDGERPPRQTDDHAREKHGVFPTIGTDAAQHLHRLTESPTSWTTNCDRFGHALCPGEVEGRVARDGPAVGTAGYRAETARGGGSSLLALLVAVIGTALVALRAVSAEQQCPDVLVDLQLQRGLLALQSLQVAAS